MSKQAGAMLTPLALSVLALLEERPMHPYEMYQLMLSRREDYLVKIRPGSLYHTVDRLVEQAMVSAEGIDRAGNRPERTTYRITDTGRAALRGRISELLRRPIREYPIFPLALAESHNLPREDVARLVTERVRCLVQDITEFDALRDWAVTHQVPRRYWLVLDYLRAQADTEVTWLRGLIGELLDGSLPWHEFAADGSVLPASDDTDIGHDWAAAVSEDVLAELRKGGTQAADR
jgi:DNA-binding PadR family transcriptional regulator